MAADYFLKIDGIPGESTDDKHKDEIEVLSFSHSLAQDSSYNRSNAGGASGGRVDHSRFNISKVLDKASPKLLIASCKGTHIKSVVLSLHRANEEKTQYMEYKLSDVLVSSVSISGSGSDIPTEAVEFNYGKIEWTYTETDHNTGKAKGKVASNWDVTTNKGA